MTVALPRPRVLTGPSVSAPTRRLLRDGLSWACFAMAAIVFVLDATLTIAVLDIEPKAVEQNPIARWTLDGHPLAPYALKAIVVAICAGVSVVARAIGEAWAAYVVSALMAVAGALGMLSAIALL